MQVGGETKDFVAFLRSAFEKKKKIYPQTSMDFQTHESVASVEKSIKRQV